MDLLSRVLQQLGGPLRAAGESEERVASSHHLGDPPGLEVWVVCAPLDVGPRLLLLLPSASGR
eukprot:1378228-Pyramimonas_sp.AAC.1